MRGPAYTDEENIYLRELVAKTGLTLENRVEAFMRMSPEDKFHARSEDAVSQKLRKMMVPPMKRPSARANVQPVARTKVNGGQAELKILGVTITGPEQNVLAVAKQLG